MSSADSGKYEVEKIIDKRETATGREYLVKWKGFQRAESTWEPANNLSKLKDLICEFEATGKKRRGRPPRVPREKVEERAHVISREDSLFCEVDTRTETHPTRLPETDEEGAEERMMQLRQSLLACHPNGASSFKAQKSRKPLANPKRAVEFSPSVDKILSIDCHFRLLNEPVFKVIFSTDALEREDALYSMEQLQRERPDLLFVYLRKLILN